MVQGLFAVLLSGMAGAFAGWMVFLVRKHWRHYIPALLGLLVLFIYVIVETASQSHVGWNFQATEKWGVRLTDLVEMTGILLILANAFIPRKKIS
jgi:drug/metabolite transporter superfamily protein YnfA